jgi:hypothetical protein
LWLFCDSLPFPPEAADDLALAVGHISKPIADMKKAALACETEQEFEQAKDRLHTVHGVCELKLAYANAFKQAVAIQNTKTVLTKPEVNKILGQLNKKLALLDAGDVSTEATVKRVTESLTYVLEDAKKAFEVGNGTGEWRKWATEMSDLRVESLKASANKFNDEIQKDLSNIPFGECDTKEEQHCLIDAVVLVGLQTKLTAFEAQDVKIMSAFTHMNINEATVDDIRKPLVAELQRVRVCVALFIIFSVMLNPALGDRIYSVVCCRCNAHALTMHARDATP